MFPCRAPGGLCGLESEICECPMVTVFWDLPAEPLDPKKGRSGTKSEPAVQEVQGNARPLQWAVDYYL